VTPPFSNRIVAFIDILGFRALVTQLAANPSLRKSVHRALAEIRVFKHASLRNETALRDLEVSVFSDSIAISGEPEKLTTIISTALGLQSKLLGLGILIRGGVSSGPTFHAEDMLYGEGLINAYDLESKTAVYPRIVIDPKLIGDTEAGLCAMFLSKEDDGHWFIDPFAMGGLPDGSDALVEDGWDPHSVFLERLGVKIEQQLSELIDERKRAKWNWLKARHAIAIAEYAKFRQPRLWHLMAQARKIGIIPESTRMTIQPGPATKPSCEWTP
jgi:hypothetical protein